MNYYKFLTYFLGIYFIFFNLSFTAETSKQKSINIPTDVVTTATPRLKIEDIKNFNIKIVSFGYDYGVPVESDIVIDVRCLPNPHFRKKLKQNNGFNPEVENFVLSQVISKRFLENLYKFLDFTVPLYVKQEGGRSSLIISFGCKGGTHRAVVIAEEVKRYLMKKNYMVEIQHRDVDKK